MKRPSRHDSTAFDTTRMRVATYNIHKGVRGVGPRKRLEIHNLGLGVEALDADLVFLQEVRLFHLREARRFRRSSFGWPDEDLRCSSLSLPSTVRRSPSSHFWNPGESVYLPSPSPKSPVPATPSRPTSS